MTNKETYKLTIRKLTNFIDSKKMSSVNHVTFDWLSTHFSSSDLLYPSEGHWQWLIALSQIVSCCRICPIIRRMATDKKAFLNLEIYYQDVITLVILLLPRWWHFGNKLITRVKTYSQHWLCSRDWLWNWIQWLAQIKKHK